MSKIDLSQENFLLPPKTSSKKTLVLDLDETLVHSQFIPYSIKSDLILKIDIENKIHDIHVLFRPGIQNFLKKLAKLYEIVIFTASVSKYADPLLDIIDKNNYCSHRLFREHCSMMGITYIKDLKKLGRDLKDVVIVDNSPLSYSFNKENGIPILAWFNDKNDKELYNLLPILEFLSIVDDVRYYIKEIVINDTICFDKAIDVIENFSRLNKDFRCKKYIQQIIFNQSNTNKKENKGNYELNKNIISNLNSKEKNKGYINITISNNEINNYLYFSPIYTINNNINNTNPNNDFIENLDIKINNEYDKSDKINQNQKEKKQMKIISNSNTNRTISKCLFNKININNGKNKVMTKGKKTKQIKLTTKKNEQRNIILNNLTNKSINYAILLNNSYSKDHSNDSNIVDLKNLISSKKFKLSKNFSLPKTPEIEQILYDTSSKNSRKNFMNKKLYQTNFGNITEKNNIGKYNFRNSANIKNNKIYTKINHEKHKSFNYYTNFNFDTNFMTLQKKNINDLFCLTKKSSLVKNNSLSNHKTSNTIRTNKINNMNISEINNDIIKTKYKNKNFHRKVLSNQFKIIGITEFNKTCKAKKQINYNLQNKNLNSKRNNKSLKINQINRTINNDSFTNYSLKNFYTSHFKNANNTLTKTNQINSQNKLFKPIFTNKIKKYDTNSKEFNDYNNILRHKKTLSFNGDIYAFRTLNKTNTSSYSKRSNQRNNFDKSTNIASKNKKKAINEAQKKKLTTIKKIREIKFIKVYDKKKINKIDINKHIFNKILTSK